MLSRATIIRRSRKPNSSTSRSASANRSRRKRNSRPRGTSLRLVNYFPFLSISPAALRLAGERRNKMPQFILLLRDERRPASGLSPEETQKLIQKYGDWRRTKAIGGQKLTDGEGRVLRKQNGKPSVTDGPFVEAKEVMGGFFVIEAGNYDEAVELAKTCPHIEFGTIEIREIQYT